MDKYLNLRLLMKYYYRKGLWDNSINTLSNKK